MAITRTTRRASPGSPGRSPGCAISHPAPATMNDYSDPIVIAFNCSLNMMSMTDEQITRADKLQNFSGRARMSSVLWTLKVDIRWCFVPRRWHRAVHRNLCVQRRNADRHAHHVARRRLRPAVGYEQAAFLAALGRAAAQPGPALSVAVQQHCYVLLSAATIRWADVSDQPLAVDRLKSTRNRLPS